jgi:hypothetical protein
MKIEKSPNKYIENKIIEEEPENENISGSVQHLVKEISRIGIIDQNKAKNDTNKLISGIELKDEHGRILNNLPTLIYNHQSTLILIEELIKTQNKYTKIKIYLFYYYFQ